VQLFNKHLRINLALQGGGAHGAFTWGVLERLLEDECIEFSWISATSAGAVNAVAVAAGLAQGGRPEARATLAHVWDAVHQAGVPDLLRLNPFFYGLSRSGSLAQVASLWSPYEFNPLGFDPLRRLLDEHIDFELVRASPVELLIAATRVATGRARLFRRQEITLEAVLASACLPTLHHAVQIDGEAYWDGGFSANPDIVTLARESPVEDTLIVQLNPMVRHETPLSARDIAAHANRITFNAPLQREVEVIETAREAYKKSRFGGKKTGLARLVNHRFHLIEAGRYTGSLSPESLIKPDKGLFTYLHGAGRTEAEKWLERNRAAVGVQSTVDLKTRFLTMAAFDGEEDSAAEAGVAPGKAAAG
jgi:NTE family protein